MNQREDNMPLFAQLDGQTWMKEGVRVVRLWSQMKTLDSIPTVTLPFN